MAGKVITVSFTREKETKNTIRYTEVIQKDYYALVGTIYIQKFAIEENFGSVPEEITVTIKPGG